MSNATERSNCSKASWCWKQVVSHVRWGNLYAVKNLKIRRKYGFRKLKTVTKILFFSQCLCNCKIFFFFWYWRKKKWPCNRNMCVKLSTLQVYVKLFNNNLYVMSFHYIQDCLTNIKALMSASGLVIFFRGQISTKKVLWNMWLGRTGCKIDEDRSI